MWPPGSPDFNPLNAELNPIRHLLALVGAHHILHVSRVRVKLILSVAWFGTVVKLRDLFCNNLRDDEIRQELPWTSGYTWHDNCFVWYVHPRCSFCLTTTHTQASYCNIDSLDLERTGHQILNVVHATVRHQWCTSRPTVTSCRQ